MADLHQGMIKKIAGLKLDPGLRAHDCNDLLGAINRFQSNLKLEPMVLRVRDRLAKIRKHSRKLGRFLAGMRDDAHPGRKLKQIENAARQLARLMGDASEENLFALKLCFPFEKIDPIYFGRALYHIAMLGKAGDRKLLGADLGFVLEILSHLERNCNLGWTGRPRKWAVYIFIHDVGSVFQDITGGGVGAYYNDYKGGYQGRLLHWVVSLAKLGGIKLHPNHIGQMIYRLRRGMPQGEPRLVLPPGNDGPYVSETVARALFKGNKKTSVVLNPGDIIKLDDGSRIVVSLKSQRRIDRQIF